VVRLGLRRKPSGDNELYYRLILSEVPGEVSRASRIATALRLSLPVFYTPPGAMPEPKWSVGGTAEGDIRVELGNTGNAHFKMSEVAIVSPADPATPLAAGKGFQYVLPGATRVWTFTLDGIAPGTPLLLRARNRKEPLEHSFEMPPR